MGLSAGVASDDPIRKRSCCTPFVNAAISASSQMDLAKPSDYIRRVMPNWEEPPVHQDLIAFDMTVTAGGERIIDEGFLVALRDPSVVEMAKRYGDPVELLEGGPA